ncbi:MAG: hypothetical protein ABUK13_02755 [Gammaproteobacteria bacterium]
MANDWFSGFPRLAKGTKARADAVNAIFDENVTGMDKMPTEAQMNRGTRNYIADDTGSADAYAGVLAHVTGAYADGQEVDILIANTNLTATPTLNVSTIGNVVIKASGANPVPIGALAEDSIARLKYNDTLSHWELIGVYDITNTVSAFMATMLDDPTAAAALITLGLTATAAEINTLDGVTAFVATLFNDETASAFMDTLGITAYAQTLLDDADAAAARATLGVNAEEKGTFTPTIYGGTTPGSPTYSLQNGWYSINGDTAHIEINIILSAKGGLAGELRIGGLPFTGLSHVMRTTNAPTSIWISGASGLAAGDNCYFTAHASDYLSLAYGDMVSGDPGRSALQDTNIVDTSVIQINATILLSS